MARGQLLTRPCAFGGVQGPALASLAGSGGGSMLGSWLRALLLPAQQPAAACTAGSPPLARAYSGGHDLGAEHGLPAAPPAPDAAAGARRGAAPSGPPSKRVQLVRAFIRDSMHHPSEGYLARQAVELAGMPDGLRRPLDMPSLSGQAGCLLAIQGLYQQLQAPWLTPAEVFQPHYGRSIAECILARHHRQAAGAVAGGAPEPELQIVEVGGGSGTLARDILDWLRSEHPAAYSCCHYTSVQPSPVLAALQRRRVASEGGHAPRFSVRQHDAADALAWEAADVAAEGRGGRGSRRSSSSNAINSNGGAWEQHAFIVMCDVLETLPHDRVWRDMGSSEWQQTLVAESGLYDDLGEWSQRHQRGGEGKYYEVTAPVEDELIRRCLQAAQAAASTDSGGRPKSGVALSAARAWRRLTGEPTYQVLWLPTGCLQLLDTLHRARPSHTLIAADVSSMPEETLLGENAPAVVSTAGAGMVYNHGSYLLPRGSAGTLFPTNFSQLAQLYRDAAVQASSGAGGPASAAGVQASRAQAQHLPTADFMLRYSPSLQDTCTSDGYNPLLEDALESPYVVGSCLWPRSFFIGSSTTS